MKRKHTIGTRCTGFLLVLLLPWLRTETSSAQPTRFKVSAIEARALASVILELETRHGWIITYEDPPYEWANDIDDVTATVRRSGGQGKRVLIPRERSFEFDYDNIDTSRPHDLLSSMLAHYAASGKDEAFRLVQQGPVYHVVPTRSANAKGISQERTSLLDTRVNVEAGDRSAFEVLQLALKQIHALTGVPLRIGNIPGNLLDRTRIRVGAVNEVARNFFVRTLAATNRDLSWQIFCDPAPALSRECFLNIHSVESSK